MTAAEYLAGPCTASSLPWWKTESVPIPEHMSVVRDDLFSPERFSGRDDPYFRVIHHLDRIAEPGLPAGFRPDTASMDEFADHIRGCYPDMEMSGPELQGYMNHPVYVPSLWIAVREQKSGTIAASGIAEYDRRIGEGILEWIQVSPTYRRKGLGRFVVCELLRRLQGEGASFATVSGRMRNPDRPLLLYRSCGFADPVIWHVITR